MKTKLSITIELDDANPADVERFEKRMQTWIRQQAPVQSVSISRTDTTNEAVWRQARKETFGPRLRNPFAP